MMRRAVSLTALIVVSAPAAAAPQLSSRPAATAATLTPGETTLANGAVVYRPASLPPGPAALVILLHGAGGYPLDFLEQMKPVADQRGLLLLFPHSRGRTWDFIQNLAAERDPWRGGLDAHRLDQSLGDLFARAPVDPKRIVLLGFSDGASFGLSLGTANPQLFSAVVALSPGMFVPPDSVDRAQRVFIAHGRSDHVLAFENTSETIVRSLRAGGANLVFRPFAGDHQIDGKVLIEALDFALGLQAPGPAPTSNPK